MRLLLALFVPSMRKKDQSLSRYPEFADYRLRSGLLLPRLFGTSAAGSQTTAGETPN